MSKESNKEVIISMALSILLVGFFVIWAVVDAQSLHNIAYEDGPLEMATAVLFGLSGVNFIIFMKRSDFIKDKDGWFKYFFTLCWAATMIIFMGEEISWGQRIIGFATPEAIIAINDQEETTVHNLVLFHKLGGEYRVISLIILTTGLFLPLIALTKKGIKAVQRYAFPVSPLGYAILFIGAYSYGKYCRDYFPYSNDASEVREFLWSLGMFVYTLHGAVSPKTLFRLSKK